MSLGERILVFSELSKIIEEKNKAIKASQVKK
jgi:hypothetical protein